MDQGYIRERLGLMVSEAGEGVEDHDSTWEDGIDIFENVNSAPRRTVSPMTYLLAGNWVFLFLDCAMGSNDCASSRLREVLKDDDASRSSSSEVFTAVATDACRTCLAADGRQCVYLATARRDAQPTSPKDIVLWCDVMEKPKQFCRCLVESDRIIHNSDREIHN